MLRNLTLALTLFAALVGATAPATAAADHVVTMWWVVFNNPEACATSPCTDADFFVPEVEASVLFASGQPTRGHRLDYVAALYETSDSFAGVDPNTSVIGGPGLLDAHNAEIHLVLRDHGPRLPGQLISQLTQFTDAGCSELGGPNTCVDVQFAIFQAAGEAETQSELFRFADGSAVDGSRSMLIRQDGVVKAIVVTDLD